VSWPQLAAFWGGWLALAAALVSPLHPLGGVLFSAHMAQHELMMVVAAPLLVLARPLAAVAWALPPGGRRALGAVGRAPAWAGAWRRLTKPVVAWVLHVGALLVWHLPALYQATLRSDAVHAAQHASFLGTGLLFWWAMLAGRRAARGAAVAWLFGAFMVTGGLGAALTLAGTLWYPDYAATTAPWGLMPLDDQRVGGMIMWVPGGVSYLLAALRLVAGWLREPERARVTSGTPYARSSA
jgi:cytochrome c oxidase assembly factor CtaG